MTLSKQRKARHHFPLQQAGFSLLEILVAFAILALSLGVLFQIYSKGTQSTLLTRDYSTAVLIAEAQLAQLEVMETLEPGTQNGTALNRYHWTADIQPYETAEEPTFNIPYGLFTLTLEVSWESLGKTRRINLQTIRLAHKG